MTRDAPATVVDRPVKDFPIKFRWQKGFWEKIFDEQIKLVKSDITRARYEDRLVVYLSCPISSRGGGYGRTNSDIAKHTERRLLSEWGDRFWILNPAQYQMESKEGEKTIIRHAENLHPPVPRETLDKYPPKGGDYMRMWTRVLVEDGQKNEGRNFDMFYFLGPTDTKDFFTRDRSMTVTAGVEDYFARKFAMDQDFRDTYSLADIKRDRDERNPKNRGPATVQQEELRHAWREARRNFFRYYAVKASANFSLGSHDEWQIFILINQKRLRNSRKNETPNGDVGELLPGFFDGKQIDPGAAVTLTSGGNAISWG